MHTLCTFLIKLFIISVVYCDNVPFVTIKQGSLTGKYLYSTHGRKFSAFTGIPYATPPLGALRFQAPVPAGPWNGVLNASKPHAVCPQINAIFGDFTPKGDENCLYLNVYTPEVSSKKLPVLFYIHCGGFMWGSANSNLHGPHHLLDKDIVIVSANYRLGALGFFSTGDEVVPGNNGLKDQNLALKWTLENIENFGGDPNQITMYGQSAGGTSTHLHMLSPLSKHYIKRAISSSGTALSPYTFSKKSETQDNSLKLATHFNCPTEPSYEMVSCLQKIDVMSIVDQEKTLYDYYFIPIIPFKPVIEPDVEGAFISESPWDIISSGKAADIPFMVGTTTEEGTLLSAGIYKELSYVEDLHNRFDELLPKFYFYDRTADQPQEVTNKIKSFYFKNDSPTPSSLTNCTSDSWFGIAADESARLQKQYNTAPIYYYLFEYRGSKSFTELLGHEVDYGVAHCDDLLYLVTMDIFDDYQPNQADKDMTDTMVNLWTNFIITGNPNPSESDEIWKPVATDNLEYLSIKSAYRLEMEKDLYSERYHFWRNLHRNFKLNIKDEL